MTLPTRKLGTQGLEAAAMGLGCMSLVPGGGFYDPEGLTEEAAVAVIHRALDLGVTLVGRDAAVPVCRDGLAAAYLLPAV
jgi:aryl-alcohol dehydrogenase-like predicted oxidoreductase